MTDYTVCYFSGTGNTKKCAEEIAAVLREKGETAVNKIETGAESVMPQGTLVIGYPVHGFGAPRVILKFAEGLPEGDLPVYIFKTSGEPLRLNDDSSHSLRKILTKKGYDVRGEYHYVMPYNMIFRHSDEMASKMFLTAKKRIAWDAREISDGIKRDKKIILRARLAYVINRIERPGVRFNGRFFRVKKDICTKCNLCVKSCPTKNITYRDGKFRFGGDCILCARCSFFCPKNAVRIGLMDFMRVNGRYDFNADPEKAVVGRYCRKSYARYFSEE